MNCRTASSVCGAVGFAAIELLDARDELPPPNAEAENDDPSSEEPPPPPPAPLPLPLPLPAAEGSCGGWWRRRNRAPEGVRKAVMYAEAGG